MADYDNDNDNDQAAHLATVKGPSWSQIHAVIEQRRSFNDLAINEMMEVRKRYNADWVMPLTDVQGEPTMPQIGPALIAESIDTTALMAASVRPIMSCPPIDPSKEIGVKSRAYGETRKKILHATWHASKGGLVRRRAYRHMAGYATATLIARPDFGLGHPVIEIRDPLGCYPEPKAPEDLTPPCNIGYIYQRSATWLRYTYPSCRREHGGPIGEPSAGETDLWDLLEWMDNDCTVIGIMGPCEGNQSSARWSRSLNTGTNSPYHDGPITSIELFRWANLSGKCPVITLPRVTLDRIASSIAHQVGNIDLMTQLLALAIAAEERAVFADKYAIGRQNGRPAIVSNGGAWKDGRTGEINILQDIEQVGALQTPAAPTAVQMVNALERNSRVSMGFPGQLSGENNSSLRTGRAMDSLMGVSVDPRVQELQEIFELGAPHLNEIVLDQWKAYWPDKKTVMMTGWTGYGGLVEFTPKDHIEVTFNVVRYPILGMDAQGLTVTLGQLFSMGAISLTTLREMHPYIDDPTQEGRSALEEMLEKAVFDSIAQGAQSGQQDPMKISLIEKHIKKGLDIFRALEAADKEARILQATPAPAPAEGLVAAPETMPGLAAPPGTPQMAPPAEELNPAVPPPNTSQQDLDQLLQALEAH